ncbi:MAG: DUF1553 domain-containing protein [Verrucomicrobia bacterium]|nr:DUF1553 domain-containing protein [Verrucomicrobiota bacterium]
MSAGLLATGGWATAGVSAEDTAFFESKVRPLLSKHCGECHSAKAEKVKGGLLLDSREGWMAGGDSGEVIVPGRPAESLLLRTVLHTDPDLQMPPKYKLAEGEIEVLETWIAMGAPDPRSGTGVAKVSPVDQAKARSHWAYQPMARPEVPKVADASWPRSETDHFILRRIEDAGLRPVGDADRSSLLRRVFLDLTGLPPTLEEIRSFLAHPGSDEEALAQTVDRLLASPAFGERWGRHWLDVARYADSVGKTRNVPFPFAWRYRNHVIDAFNAGQPYDRFLMEQIAGDLLPAENRQSGLVATGLLALGSMDLNERDSDQFLLDRIDDQLDTLGRSTMALTLGCARCHDHKFDPITQAEYYALAGIFASTRTLSGQTYRKGGSKEYTQVRLLASLDGSKPQGKSGPEEIESRIRELREEAGRGETTEQRRRALREEANQLRQQLAGMESDRAEKKSKKQRSDGQIDLKAPLAMAVCEGEVCDLELRVRGEPDIKGAVVPRGFPGILSGPGTPEIPAEGSGRLELARWLTSPDHPLTARVMVNRVWSHLFGRGLVETVDNFGLSGAEPTHPELLDHLASGFVAEGWSVKKLVRSLVMSRTYRLGIDYPAANVAKDEANRWWWRANLRRLEAEAIRDSLLASSGLLEPDRPEGAPFDRFIGSDVGKVAKRGGGMSSDLILRPERSVYLPVFRSRLPGMFTVFDFAEPDQVNGQRDVTTVPTQALFFLNNPLVLQCAESCARQLLAPEDASLAGRIESAYLRILGRVPGPAESGSAEAFVRESEAPPEKAWAALVQALYASAEFRYVR